MTVNGLVYIGGGTTLNFKWTPICTDEIIIYKSEAMNTRMKCMHADQFITVYILTHVVYLNLNPS